MWIPDIRRMLAGWPAPSSQLLWSHRLFCRRSLTMGVCRVARQSAGAGIVPITDGGSYLFMYHGNDPRYKEKPSGQFFADAKITLIKGSPSTASWSLRKVHGLDNGLSLPVAGELHRPRPLCDAGGEGRRQGPVALPNGSDCQRRTRTSAVGDYGVRIFSIVILSTGNLLPPHLSWTMPTSPH